MKLRIRPSGICACKVRVIRPASGVDVVLALLLSTLFVTAGLVSFTMMCWKVGSELGMLPLFPHFWGPLHKRESWLLLAALAWLFARLFDAFANSLKGTAQRADELPAERLDRLVAVPE